MGSKPRRGCTFRAGLFLCGVRRRLPDRRHIDYRWPSRVENLVVYIQIDQGHLAVLDEQARRYRRLLIKTGSGVAAVLRSNFNFDVTRAHIRILLCMLRIRYARAPMRSRAKSLITIV